LFLIVYGACNWITGRRNDVGFLNFQWERCLPFVPSLIIPYLSIDLFFIAAPFLLRTKDELSTFTKRVTMVILVAGTCFLLYPFQFAFARPYAEGWSGALFNWFRQVDAPYNLFPSLHVALCLLLANVYARQTHGITRMASNVWFGLIGLSAVLTYQHHVLDVIGGLALAGYGFYFIRESASVLPVVKNRRIGSYYVVGCLIGVTLAALFWRWGSLFLWPTMSLAIVASAYFGVGPSIFRKTNGVLPISTRFALGPCLIGQRLSLWYYRRQCYPWAEVTHRVWIGSIVSKRQAERAVDNGVTAVLDLTAEFSENRIFRSLCYRNVPVLDLTSPTLDQLKEMSDFIDEHTRNGVVYVHCKIGYSRSAVAIAAWLLETEKAKSVEEALAAIRFVRPTIVIRPEVISTLRAFSARFRPAVTI